MGWNQLSFESDAQWAEQAEELLLEAGACSVTFQEIEALPSVLEPGVGETPLWDYFIVKALFDEELDVTGVQAQLKSHWSGATPLLITQEFIADQAWERICLEDSKPLCFGGRFWIYPSHIEPPADILAMRLDPGLAFGTGTHPTTALCLEYLSQQDLSGKTILDFGCGSGILAIAALKMGAAIAFCVDNDPQALLATADNAQRNEIPANQIDCFLPEHFPGKPVDFLIANILAEPLHALSASFVPFVKEGGGITLSGVLREQADALQACYQQYFDMTKITTSGDWVRLDGQKPTGSMQ